MIYILRKIETFFSLIEKYLLICLIIFILLLSFGSIVFRNLEFSIPPWVSSILQQSVLWIAFLGASLASRYNRQINFNILNQFFANRPFIKRFIEALTNLFIVPVAALLCFGAFNFVLVEKEWGIDIPSIGIQSWYFEIILVYVFAIISFKYLVRFLEIVKGIPLPEEIEEIENNKETQNQYNLI